MNLAGYLKIENVPYVVEGISGTNFLKLTATFLKELVVKPPLIFCCIGISPDVFYINIVLTFIVNKY
jgi:hypothetical protein